jgi:hypothetical protein
MGIGTGLARAYAGAQGIAREREAAAKAEQEKQALAAIQMAALEAGLRERGVVSAGEAQESPLEIPVPGMDGFPGMTTTVPSGRYEPLGATGRVRDTWNTPDAKQRVQQALQQRQRAQEQESERRQRLVEIRERAAAEAAARAQAVADQIKVHQTNRRFDVANPMPRAASEGPAGGVGTWVVQDTPDGKVQVNNKTGEVRALQAPGGGALKGKQPGTVTRKIAENEKAIAIIGEAMREVGAHPSAVGAKRLLLPDFVSSRTDPNGVTARAAVSDIGSLQLHERSGAAVTVSEWPRLRPFIPKTDDDAATVQKKLARLLSLIQAETKALSGTASGESDIYGEFGIPEGR